MKKNDIVIEKLIASELAYHEGKLTLVFKALYLLEATYEYAFYIYQDDHVIEREWYQPLSKKQTAIEYWPIRSGAYKVRLFLKKNGEVIANKVSNILNVDIVNNQTIKTTLEKEKIYYADNPVRYLFQKARKKSDKLLISFSGIHSQEFTGGPPVYNHFRTLWPCNINKLFILDDYKGQFCYYMGHNRGMDYERSVVGLITTIANELNISAENVIVSGSSKGGAASLYYSMKYHFGTAIIGAPQVFIAKYLEQRATAAPVIRRALDNMLGDDQEAGKRYYNELIMNLVDTTTQFPAFTFHVGKGDMHYKQHLQPLLKKLDGKGVKYSLDLQNYSDHNQTGQYYAPFLLKTVTELLEDKK
ncbi:accessory Sec system protein Asp2 [Listeria costaricensis]|uniref:accessory Sec system protein Asp2 n=1 Tax=Listeria costaricensis TaxID=2026604 RepID=UPI000C07BF11|nr:accessory Sec system protein Asp2 [Listeria costaricensis]